MLNKTCMTINGISWLIFQCLHIYFWTFNFCAKIFLNNVNNTEFSSNFWRESTSSVTYCWQLSLIGTWHTPCLFMPFMSTHAPMSSSLHCTMSSLWISWSARTLLPISWSLIFNWFACNLHNRCLFCETINTRGASTKTAHHHKYLSSACNLHKSNPYLHAYLWPLCPLVLNEPPVHKGCKGHQLAWSVQGLLPLVPVVSQKLRRLRILNKTWKWKDEPHYSPKWILSLPTLHDIIFF